MRRPNVTLWSEGATLHASDASDQALWISVSGVSVYGFRLTAVTENRRVTPWESRIAVFERADGTAPLERLVIRGNTITHLTQAAGPLGNGTSSAGIFIYRAKNFLVAENTVLRSLSDGIHITAGSSNGRVLKNTVRETGDDMIAIVSYLGDGDWTQADTALAASQIDARRTQQMNHNILIAGNDVAGQYWGRGIAVVGGRDLTIRNNRVSNTTMASGILLAREDNAQTFGVRNVLVSNNTIEHVQTLPPGYVPDQRQRPLTYQGGVEIHAFVLHEEQPYATLMAELAVERIAVEDNRIDDVIQHGVRIGVGWGSDRELTTVLRDGTRLSKLSTGGLVRSVAVSDNQITRVGGRALRISNEPPADQPVFCSSAASGLASSDPRCNASIRPVVSGANLSCS